MEQKQQKETLNARGEPLLPSDLLRNFIFWRASRQDEEKDELYDKYWLPFDQKFWKREERLGRLKRPRIDIFMQHYLESQEGREINISRLFHEYKNWIKEQSPFETVEAELKNLTSYANIFRDIIEPDPEAQHGLFFLRLKQIDVTTIYPLLLYILNHPDRAEQDVEGMLLDLESYLFRRLICGLTPKNYNRLFVQLVRDLIREPFSRETLQRRLIQMTGDAGMWPDDSVFGNSWMTRNVYLEMKPAQRIVTVLKAIEDSLRHDKNEKMLIQSPLTIEHIMPQAWEKTWPLADGTISPDRFSRLIEGNRYTEADERDSLLHTFGNVTLLTQPLNSSVKNAPWDQKRPEICKQSALALNRYFQELPHWDSAAIRERSKNLLDVAKTIWKHPGAQ